MSEAPNDPGPTGEGKAHLTQMRLLVVVLTLVGLWMARSFLLQLAWAATIAVSLWPLYCRVARPGRKRRLRIAAPLGFTLTTGLVLMVPLIVVAIEAARDSQSALDWLAIAQKQGVAAPHWLPGLPMVGARAAAWWRSHLADPRGAEQWLGQVDAGALAR